MANEEQLAILKSGVEEWNQWRKDNRPVKADLRDANLRRANLSRATLRGATLNSTTWGSFGIHVKSSHMGILKIKEGLIRL